MRIVEPAIPAKPFLVSFFVWALGTYAFLAGLALAALDGGRWGYLLVLLAVALFGVAALSALRLRHS